MEANRKKTETLKKEMKLSLMAHLTSLEWTQKSHKHKNTMKPNTKKKVIFRRNHFQSKSPWERSVNSTQHVCTKVQRKYLNNNQSLNCIEIYKVLIND